MPATKKTATATPKQKTASAPAKPRKSVPQRAPSPKRADGKRLYDIDDMITRIHAYIDKHKGYEPLLAADGNPMLDARGKPVYEWKVPIAYKCYQENGWNKRQVNKLAETHEDLKDAIEELKDAKKYWLERGGMGGYIKENFAQFLLKQLGYTDSETSTVTLKLSSDIQKYAK